MICLECGTDNTYGSPLCAGCQLELTTIPPYVKSNHICQMQMAITDYLEGSLSRDQLGKIIATFLGIVARFEEIWGVGTTNLASRVAEPLREHFGAGIRGVDRGVADMVLVADLLGEFQEGGPDELLGPVNEKLLDCFHLICQGCALLIHELELEELRQIKLGTTHDYSA